MTPVDIFEAAAEYRKAHAKALSTGAYTRNYDHPHYAGIRNACQTARRHFEWAMSMKKTAALKPEYAVRMGWT